MKNKTEASLNKWLAHYQNMLGLLDWRIRVKLVPGEIENKGMYCNGTVDYSLDGMYANIQVTKDGVNKMGCRALMKHELLHLLIGKLTIIGKARYISEGDIEIANESIVRVLEKVVP